MPLTTSAPSKEAARSKAVQEVREYDYVRFTMTDVNGMARGRTVPARHAPRYLDSGIGIYKGALVCGPRTELPKPLNDEHMRRFGKAQGNLDIRPDLATLHPVPWAGFGKYRVGEVLCDLYLKEGDMVDSSPRYAALKQLERLDQLGLQIMSSFEFEFILEDRQTRVPVFDGNDILSNLIFGEHEKFLYQVDQDMLKAGVDVEMLQTELSPGQFEITIVPVYGIEVADKALILKQGLKEIAHQHGLEACFMAKPYLTEPGNGAHYNFSLWNKSDGSNALYDKDGEDRLSATARYWLGGMLKHGAALSAFQSPTVNCYRRLQCEWAPSVISWGIENRNASIRVKNSSPKSTYMENRMPSGSSNPYLVLASVLAAGLDGIANKIEPLEQGSMEAPKLPKNLSDALKALEEDKVITEAIGEDLVSWFTTLKRLVDLEKLKESDVTVADQNALLAERKMYNVTI